MVRVRGVLTTVLVITFYTQLAESREASDCACPKEGRWKAQNLEGYMNCTGPFNM